MSTIATQRATEVDGRQATLRREVTDAKDKLKRLYQLVENGLADLDDILKERIHTLKRVQKIPSTDIPPQLIEEFGLLTREKISAEEVPLKKAYRCAVINRIEAMMT